MEIVPSHGPMITNIALVGEAPGRNEVQIGRPFVGSSGGLLRTMCMDSGIVFEQCRLLNVMQTRPPRNDFGSFYHDKARHDPKPELIAGRTRLKEELRKLRPNVVVALGNEPLKALVGKDGIKKWRGTIHITDFGKVIGTYHPSHILRYYQDRPISQVDLQRVSQESLSPSTYKIPIKPILEPSRDQILAWLEEHKDSEFCTFDTETLGRLIRCLGLCVKDDSAICIPFMRVNRSQKNNRIILLAPPSDNPSYWTIPDELIIIDALQKFFLSKETKFVAQNFSFDMPLLEDNFGLRINNFYLDTMHAHHLAYPELPKSLDFLASVYTNIGYYADYDAKSDQSTWLYNCHDCIATFQSIKPILRELDGLGLKDFYFNHTHKTEIVATSMQSRGVLIDVKNRKKFGAPIKAELYAIRETFKTKYNLNFNIQIGPEQAKKVLKKLNIPIPIRKGKETTDKRALDSLMIRYPDEPFFRLLLEQRKLQKLYGTYVTSPLDDDNRMRTSYDVSGTKGSRLSSSKTLWGTGGNLQNIPRGDFRKMFIVPPDHYLLHADLSQAETRLVAWLSKNKILIDRFVNDEGFDVHRYTASKIYDVPENLVDSDQRYKAKQCNHSGNYGISWKKFSYISELSPKEAKFALTRHQSDPFLQAWWRSIQLKLQEDRTLITPEPFRRKRIFYGRLDEETFRQAYNWIPQTTVGDVINDACWEIDSELDSSKARLILQVHDEVDIEVHKDYLYKATAIIKKALEIPIIFKDLPPLLIPVEFSFGPNWNDQTDIRGELL